ncbi:MAG TPA: hypothetical protein PLW50_00425 [Smithellaceae bacterium]|nr:hypothetical protein [Smithellaceae bacterium]
MVHVVPNSIIITPDAPTDATAIRFSFKAALDPQDWAFIAGFHAIYYILKRSSGTAPWSQLAILDCNNCVAMSAISPTDLSKEVNALPAGEYDFMIIEQGDYQGTGKNDVGRYAQLSNVLVEHGAGAGESMITFQVTPAGAVMVINGTRIYDANTPSISGKAGTTATVSVTKDGYIPYSRTFTFGNTDVHEVITLDICYPGGLGCAIECTPACDSKTENCVAGSCVKKPQAECEGLNRDGSLDPTCIMAPGNEIYLYGIIGIIAYFLLTSGGEKK